MPLECSVTANSWWMLHSWPTLDHLWDDFRSWHSRISERSWLPLPDINGQISSTTAYLNESFTPKMLDLNWSPQLDYTTGLSNSFLNHKQQRANLTCVGRLICLEGCESTLTNAIPPIDLKGWQSQGNHIDTVLVAIQSRKYAHSPVLLWFGTGQFVHILHGYITSIGTMPQCEWYNC